MRIKKYAALSVATIALAAVTASTAVAQENLMQMVRSDIRAEAQQLTTIGMALSEADAQKFWPIYREYELERSQWVDTRIAMIRSYAENFETMTDEKAAELSDTAFKLLHGRVGLQQKYYALFAEAVGATAALRWVQVEHQLNLVLDVQFAAEVPLVFKTDGS
jgi:hypothetical protein